MCHLNLTSTTAFIVCPLPDTSVHPPFLQLNFQVASVKIVKLTVSQVLLVHMPVPESRAVRGQVQNSSCLPRQELAVV